MHLEKRLGPRAAREMAGFRMQTRFSSSELTKTAKGRIVALAMREFICARMNICICSIS